VWGVKRGERDQKASQEGGFARGHPTGIDSGRWQIYLKGVRGQSAGAIKTGEWEPTSQGAVWGVEGEKLF